MSSLWGWVLMTWPTYEDYYHMLFRLIEHSRGRTNSLGSLFAFPSEGAGE